MGQFIGGAGAAFILAAGVMVIIKFFMDTDVIKNKNAVAVYTKISLAALAVGVAYVFLAALIFNSIKDRMNFFEFDKFFDFLDVKKTMTLCCEFDIRYAADGLMMPLYPYIVHVIGGFVFKQYLLTAEFVSFASACISACLLYSIARRKFTKEVSENILFEAASLPYAFMLFAPTYISFSIMLILLAAVMLSKKNIPMFIAAAALACASSKIGLIALLFYPLYKAKVFDRAAKVIDKNKFLNNDILNKIMLTVLVTVNGVILSYLIRGIR